MANAKKQRKFGLREDVPPPRGMALVERKDVCMMCEEKEVLARLEGISEDNVN